MTSSHRLQRWGGLAVWLGVGVPIWLQRDQVKPGAFAVWLTAWLLFAAAFWVTSAGRERTRRLDLALLALQAACVMALVLFLCDGFEGALLVLVAMQLAPRVSGRTGLLWIAVQSLLLGIAITIHWSLRPALMLIPPYLGFQILVFLAIEALHREARAHAELRAAREILAHGSRVAERPRTPRARDDGRGAAEVAAGRGLAGMRERLERAGGRLEVATRPGMGFAVEALVPLRRGA